MIRTLVVIALLVLPSVAAFSQNKHAHNHGAVEKGPNGGQMVEAGDYHVELLTSDGIVNVNVMDHDNKPMPTKGYKGVAILSIDGKSQRIVLEPADASRLTGKAGGAVPRQPKGVVQITPLSGKTVNARFN